MPTQPQFVDLAYVKLVGSMPPADVDAVDSLYPGTFDAIAVAVSSMFEARLSKRYATPFEAPYPESLRWAVAHVVAAELWAKRGYNPSGADEIIQRRKQEALDWLKEAADSKDGLLELPKRADTIGASGVTKGGPIATSQASPYEWIDDQARALDGR
jgi:hypothetical protein